MTSNSPLPPASRIHFWASRRITWWQRTEGECTTPSGYAWSLGRNITDRYTDTTCTQIQRGRGSYQMGPSCCVCLTMRVLRVQPPERQGSLSQVSGRTAVRREAKARELLWEPLIRLSRRTPTFTLIILHMVCGDRQGTGNIGRTAEGAAWWGCSWSQCQSVLVVRGVSRDR